MMGVLMALGWLLLTLLKIAGVLLLILLVLLALVLLCPLCADVCWEGGVLTVRAGALGLALPVFQWPAPEKPAGAEEPKGFWRKLKAKFRARREERKRKKAAAKEAKRPKKETAPREKAKLTLNISFGFASAGTDFDGKNAANKDLFGGGSGAGVNIQPVAFLVVKDGCVRTIQLSDGSNTVDRALTMLPELVDKVSALLKKEEKKDAAAPAAPAAE